MCARVCAYTQTQITATTAPTVRPAKSAPLSAPSQSTRRRGLVRALTRGQGRPRPCPHPRAECVDCFGRCRPWWCADALASGGAVDVRAAVADVTLCVAEPRASAGAGDDTVAGVCAGGPRPSCHAPCAALTRGCALRVVRACGRAQPPRGRCRGALARAPARRSTSTRRSCTARLELLVKKVRDRADCTCN
jgi:hypothetical protein